MRAVSNTSPICNLAVIGRLELLRDRYGQIAIPPAVKAELDLLSHAAGKSRVLAALADGWLVVESVMPATVSALPFTLDAGEAEAIFLAHRSHADVLLMDERRGRAAARSLGLSVGGVLGELLHAKHKGWIGDLKTELARLRTEAGFYLDAEIECFVLSQAGE